MKTNDLYKFAVKKDEEGLFATYIDDDSFYTDGDTWEELLTNLADLIYLIKTETHKYKKEKFSGYANYLITVRYINPSKVMLTEKKEFKTAKLI